MPDDIRYAHYPSALLYGDDRKKTLRHLLWGDWVKITGPEEDGWCPVHVRGSDGWMRDSDLQTERLLEIVFVDIGQGDGCLLITPENRHWIIDAGEGDNMYRFAKWRYGGFRRKWEFEGAIMTHPDADHYEGFRPLLADPNVKVGTLYFNGCMEESGDEEKLGPSVVRENERYLTHVVQDRDDLIAFLEQTRRWKHPTRAQFDKRYPSLLRTAVDSGRIANFRMPGTEKGQTTWLPGYEKGNELEMRVLGPVLERDADGKAQLRCFGRGFRGEPYDAGKTKNGHSVVLRVQYRNISLLLGGDLNSLAEKYLMEHYAAEEPWPFAVDIAKCCHHGSADFTDEFLSRVQAAATIVSSGDEEPHAHPRSDTLGAIGRNSRGSRPLIFSTELARSTRERENKDLIEKIGRLRERRGAALSPERLAEITEELDGAVDELKKRNVTTYGAINFRTDGKKAVLAYKLERKSASREWDIYRLEQQNGVLDFVR